LCALAGYEKKKQAINLLSMHAIELRFKGCPAH